MGSGVAWADSLAAGSDAGGVRQDRALLSEAGSYASASESIADGMYTFTLSGSKLRLSVAGGSWKAGANARLSSPADDIAQKFNMRKTSGEYYRITMALSGTALESGSSTSGASANVRMAKSNGKAKQLWKARATASGTEFVNKATGSVLGVQGKASNGANVRVALASGADTGMGAGASASTTPGQAWKLAATSASSNVKKFGTLEKLVKKAPTSGSRTVKVSAKGTNYTMSKARSKQLRSALKAVWKRGAKASFVMVDLNTGITVSCGANRGNHGASTFKAAYVTYLYQSKLEHGKKLDAHTRSLMAQTIGMSNNEAYLSLRSKYGTAGFRKWLNTIGLGGKANDPYPRLTARKLAKVWGKLYSYEHSNGKYVKQWRKMFNHSYYSFIREALGRKNKVYSKPGWYPPSGHYTALNDGAIVKHRDGTSYIVSVLSNVNCASDRAVMRKLAKALDAIDREIPKRVY